MLLNRTPYDKKFPQISSNTLDAIRAASAATTSSCRLPRTLRLRGMFTCFTDEQRDGYDTIEHVARQPWADGKVGMFGRVVHGRDAMAGRDAGAAEPQGDGAVDHRQRLSRQLDVPGRRLLAFFNVSWLMTKLAPARLMREREENGRGAQNSPTVMGRSTRCANAWSFCRSRSFRCFAPVRPTSSIGSNILTTTTTGASCIEEYHPKINVPR